MSRFIKKEILEKSLADTCVKLASINAQDKKNHMVSKTVDIGFSARQLLKKMTGKKTLSELQILAFRNDCVTMLAAMTAKLTE